MIDLHCPPYTAMCVTVPPLVVLVQLDELPSLVVDHPEEAAMSL